MTEFESKKPEFNTRNELLTSSACTTAAN